VREEGDLSNPGNKLVGVYNFYQQFPVWRLFQLNAVRQSDLAKQFFHGRKHQRLKVAAQGLP
jgi:hypothetical protein